MRMWNSFSDKKITVVLNGGLGNQLFQYFAGLYVAHRSNSKLKIDATFSQRGRTGHSDWIDVLNLPGTISKDAPRYSPRYIIALAMRLSRGLLARFIKSKQFRLRFLRQYRSSVGGFDPNLKDLEPPVTILGYFQTWRNYQWLKDQGVVSEVKTLRPSEWFLATQKELERQGQVLGLHFRRGDYALNPDLGILSIDYYKSAVLTLKAMQVEWDAIWVFSDDKQIKEEEIVNLFPATEKVTFVKPPLNSHSFESLSLMSKTSALVIANSTFSWWAAMLGSSQKKVICPETWFANLEDPVDLCPPDWIRVKAIWQHD